MDISYLGHSSFKMVVNSSPGGVKTKVSIITDPFDPSMVGLKYPKQISDIVTISHDHSDHNASDNVSEVKRIVSGPGEYEIMGVSIIGISSFHDKEKGASRGKNTIYVFEADGLRFAHLGDLGEMLSDNKVNEIGNVDIVMIPVGGDYTIGPKEASDLVGKIGVSFIIPMHYKVNGLGSTFTSLVSVDDFLKEAGLTVEKMTKFSIKKEDISEEQNAKIVVLESKN